MPLECRSLQLEQGAAHDSKSQHLSQCVHALSHSAQFWSTYSGYLRDVPSLCFALRQEHETYTAAKLYREMAHEKAAFLLEIRRATEDSQKGHQEALSVALQRLAAVSQRFAKDELDLRRSVVSVRETAEGAIESMIQEIEAVHLHSSQSHIQLMSQILQKAESDFGATLQMTLDKMRQQYDDDLARMVHKHEQALSYTHGTIRNRISSLLVPITEVTGVAMSNLEHARTESERTVALIADVASGLAALTTAMQDLYQAAHQVFGAVDTLHQRTRDGQDLQMIRLHALDRILDRLEGYASAESERRQRAWNITSISTALWQSLSLLTSSTTALSALASSSGSTELYLLQETWRLRRLIAVSTLTMTSWLCRPTALRLLRFARTLLWSIMHLTRAMLRLCIITISMTLTFSLYHLFSRLLSLSNVRRRSRACKACHADYWNFRFGTLASSDEPFCSEPLSNLYSTSSSLTLSSTDWTDDAEDEEVVESLLATMPRSIPSPGLGGTRARLKQENTD